MSVSTKSEKGMRISLVVAAAKGGVIGREGDLPWRIPSDLKWFKQVTLGKPVIMGRRTFDSIGKPLPGRTNIVLSRRNDADIPGCQMATSVDEAVSFARRAAEEAGADEICVIGGEQLYEAALGRADRIYFTEVDAEVEGDAWFPPLSALEWRSEPAADAPDADPRDEFPRAMRVLDRIQGGANR